MSDELWVGMMVRVIPAGRYGTIREIDTVVTRPFAVVVLDSGQVVNYELDAIEPVKFAHDLSAENNRLQKKVRDQDYALKEYRAYVNDIEDENDKFRKAMREALDALINRDAKAQPMTEAVEILRVALDEDDKK